ncbi:DUF869 domain-containing protein [Cephalotus follicularis]|uniref:DUF869 domain-containing protein n=1 Tax=Cephalotus follicularis TaxID=3775 RepID=A0A1Q3BTI8_CEPFO|nr:DUF869 domain-containing protein [Cephalotus follicularis]
MDHKTWLWRKKSTEKIIVASDKEDLSSKENEDEERHTLMNDKAELENDLKILKDKLSSALFECNIKDELVKKHGKAVEEAIGGWEKAKAEGVSLKKELDEALQQKIAGEERLNQLDAALKECMQQLRFVRDEQEQRIHDAVTKVSKEFENSQKIVEEKLAETSERLAKISLENTHLAKNLLSNEKVILDLIEQKTQVEADLNALMSRLESTEKDKAALIYEIRVLEKELEIRNEEREFSHRTVDASHKQNLESVKKIAKLESECRRLRVLVRKRLPGPASMAKMRNEVEILGRESVETRRRSNSKPNGLMVEFTVNNSPDNPSKRISFLMEQLCALEEENSILKEALDKKINELQFSRNMYAHTASKSLEFESQVTESPKGQAFMEPATSSVMSHEPSLASTSDIGSDEKVICAEPWASALISELEHFRHGKQESPSSKTVGSPDINLMDDFVEMEKFAIVSVDKPSGISHFSSEEANAVAAPLESRRSANHPDISNPLHVSGCILSKPSEKSLVMDSSAATNIDISSTEKSSQQLQSDLSKPIYKIIELIEGISLQLPNYGDPEILSKNDGADFDYKIPETPSGYMVRVIQWKTSELSPVLQQFVCACYDLLNGKVELNRFAQELASALDWIMSHCFSLQDVSSMRDVIKKHVDWDESQNGSKAEVGIMSQVAEADKLHFSGEQLFTTPNGDNYFFQREEIQHNVREENGKLRDELMKIEATKKDLEGTLQSAVDKSKSLLNQLQESEKAIAINGTELGTLKRSKGMIEDQGENHKLMSEDLTTQVAVAKVELNEAHQKVSSLEVELENKNSCFKELEATCLDLQLEPECVAKKEFPDREIKLKEMQLRSDWEITAASEKLAECQETIINLGKQLKALASPGNTVLFDKVISTPSDPVTTNTPAAVTTITTNITPTTLKNELVNQRSSLLDQMIAEDNAKAKDLESATKKGTDGNSSSVLRSNGEKEPLEQIFLNRSRRMEHNATVTALAFVPRKKGGSVSLWRKLLWKRNKASSKRTILPLAP